MNEPARKPQMVSVIVPACNAATTISDQLAALEKQTYAGDWEIIVADNRSRDETPDIVRDWEARLPRLRLIHAREQQSPGYARNVAAASADGDLLAFCDADDVADQRWLAELVRAAADSDAIGGTFEVELLNEPENSRWRRGHAHEEGLMTFLNFLPYACTGNLAVWRDTFDAVGGFPAYDMGEDIAFSWRAQLLGYELQLAREARVHLRLRADLRARLRQSYASGIGAARTYKEFRPYGAQRRPLPGAAKTWMMLVLDLRNVIRHRDAREPWLRQVAFELGQIRGALRYRVLFAG
jgi:glycosyltransferase involved in cell wall biosynthesis